MIILSGVMLMAISLAAMINDEYWFNNLFTHIVFFTGMAVTIYGYHVSAKISKS